MRVPDAAGAAGPGVRGGRIEIRVSATGTGIPANKLERVSAGGVDLVLTDLLMPGLDGSALLARLPAGLPAIVLTGLDVPAPPRAAALLRKGEICRERLAYAIRGLDGPTR